MPRRFPARTFRRSSGRANLDWSVFSDVETNVSGPSVKVLLNGFVGVPEIDQTVLRVRAALWIVTDQIIAGENQIGAWGAIVVTDDAFAAGVTAVPGPVSDAGSDWFVYQPFAQKFLFSTAAAFHANAANQIMVDSKAKRIVERNETIAVVVESSSDSEGFNFLYQGRILSKITGTR